jgi:hypothetical protein
MVFDVVGGEPLHRAPTSIVGFAYGDGLADEAV